jgi:hypothetical protein
MADKRAKGVLVSSFLGGLLVAAAVFAPRAWEPVPEPFFGLEAPADVAAPLSTPQPAPDALTAPAAAPTDTKATAAPDLEAMAVAMRQRAQRPERLAVSDGSAAVTQTVTPQALPSQAAATPESTTAPPESLKSLVTRVQLRRGTENAAARPKRIEPLPEVDSLGLAPLPGEEWTDPDSVNWSDAPQPHAATPKPRSLQPQRPAEDHSAGGRFFDRLRHPDTAGPRGGDRLLSRGRRDDERTATERLATIDAARVDRIHDDSWLLPIALIAQLEHVAGGDQAPEPTHEAARGWARDTLAALRAVMATSGPRDAALAAALLALGDTVHGGMTVADAIHEQAASSRSRRAALAVSRRVAVWRAAAGMFADLPAAPQAAATAALSAGHDPLALARAEADVTRLIVALERFEATTTAADAAVVKECLRTIAASPFDTATLARAVNDHYLAPNVRVAVHQQFLEKLMPDAQVKTGPVDEIIAGRQVRGTRTVTRTTTVKLIPDIDEVAFNLEIHGDIASRSVTDAGPVSLTSRGSSSFIVQKPVKVSAQGLLFGPANGAASNRSHLDGIQTSFDSVPVMRSLVRQIAKSQHEDALPDVNREVIDKIVATACRETDSQAEPQFSEVAERVREKLWMPMVRLGLQPTPVALETTASMATIRLRLAADSQLAAHTPRPRAPLDALMSMQVHDSSFNNAFDRLDIAGRTLSLEDLCRHFCSRLGLEAKQPDDLPEGVLVTFARTQPLRLECRDGLVHVRVALEALESGRRNWYDLVAQVAYRPRAAGPQVFLEREGPVQISGPGHQGRMEIALRTIFGKIFPKERPIAVLPERIAKNPKLASMHAVQTVASDGWFGIAMASREPPATVAAPKPATSEARRKSLLR